MRPEIKEYNFDWMLWSTFNAGARLKDGTEKEYREVLKYVPYFSQILEALYGIGEPGKILLQTITRYMENIITARERGKKIAATTFCFSPAIFYAMDIVPVCLEVISVVQTLPYKRGTADFLDYCNEVGFTETSCSSQRGAMGAFLAGLGAEIDMWVTDTPGVCDTNANAFAFAAAYLKKPFFQLDTPPVLNDPRTMEYHTEDFKSLICFLEEQTGNKLDIDRLREVLTCMAEQEQIVEELEELGRIIPNPLPVEFTLLIYASRFIFSGEPECTKILQSMLEITQENARRGVPGIASGEEKVRALFCYIDHYTTNLRLWKFMDEMGISYHGNILVASWGKNAAHVREFHTEDSAYSIDMKDLDTMIQSMAAHNARMPMVKSIRGPYDAPDMWLQDTLSLAKIYSSDCIVYNGTPGCRNTWGMVKLLARDAEKAGYPTHIMYGDAFDDRVESWEVTRDRLEEFLRVRGVL